MPIAADMYRRLAVVSVRLEELGLTHERNYRSLLRRMAGGKSQLGQQRFGKELLDS